MKDHYWPLGKSIIIGSPHDLLLTMGLEVLTQVIPIYLTFLTCIALFLFASLFVLTC